MERRKVPVTLVTGPLGSGKSTLLGHLLQNPEGRRLGVVHNEIVSALGLSDSLFRPNMDGEVVELTNGCICCNAKLPFSLREADVAEVTLLRRLRSF